jgi:quercetin dioxygenase-like cupin family protein
MGEETRLLEVLTIEPSADLRSRLLASVDPASLLAGFAPRLATFFDLPQDRAGAILRDAADVQGAVWVGTPLAGVRLQHFDGGPRFAGKDCGLVYLAPGTAFPAHGHEGDEWNLMLSGTIEEDSGERWEAGDFVIRTDGTRHSFRAVGPSPALFAVILHGRIDLDLA